MKAVKYLVLSLFCLQSAIIFSSEDTKQAVDEEALITKLVEEEDEDCGCEQTIVDDSEFNEEKAE
jgi:hypothetical protein